MAEQKKPENSIRFPAGIDNRSREYAVLAGAARSINNLDVTRDGGLKCRDGVRQVLGGACHSLYAPANHYFGLLVRDGQLCRLNSDESLSVLTAAAGPVVYALLNDEIFWSDGFTVGRILANGILGSWGLAIPAMPPVAVTATGGFAAGDYQVTMTAVQDFTGLESGAGEPVSVTVQEGGGIQVTAPSASGYGFALYVTRVYGEHHELRRAAVASPGSVVPINASITGKPLESMLAVKPLPTQALTAFRGRLLGSSGKIVWFTSEKSPHWVFPHENYLQFESLVTMLGAVEDGIYVGLADKTYFLQGNSLEAMTQRQVASSGAVLGMAGDLPSDLFSGQGAGVYRQCFWWDTNGFLCIGKPGGAVIRPGQERYSAGEAGTFYGCYRAHEGMRQLVSILASPSPISGSMLSMDETSRGESFAISADAYSYSEQMTSAIFLIAADSISYSDGIT